MKIDRLKELAVTEDSTGIDTMSRKTLRESAVELEVK
jgi:hypothetical protein